MAIRLLLSLGSLLLLSACTSLPTSRNFYPDFTNRQQVQRPVPVTWGVVQSVREVTVSPDPSGLGAAFGAVMGGLLGSEVGKGKGKTAATLTGALGGGLLGHAAERSLNEKCALEIVVRLVDGRTLAVVQEAPRSRFYPGQRVQMIGTRDQVRLVP